MNKNNHNDFVKICVYGNLEINLSITINESENKTLKMNIEEINSIKDLEKFAHNEEILNKIELLSKNFMNNLIIFVNKSFSKKTFIEVILFRKIEFKPEEKFLENILKFVTEKNLLYISSKPTTKPFNNEINIILTIEGISKTFPVEFKEIPLETRENMHTNTKEDTSRLMEGSSRVSLMNRSIKSSKGSAGDSSRKRLILNSPTKIRKGYGDERLETVGSEEYKEESVGVNLTEFMQKADNKLTECSIPPILFRLLNYDFADRDFFMVDLNAIIMRPMFEIYDILECLSYLVINFKIKIILIFPYISNLAKNLSFDLVSFLYEVITITDILIFEKKEMTKFFVLLNELSEEPKKDMRNNPINHFISLKVNILLKNKIGLFMDEFNSMTLTEQNTDNNLVICHHDFQFDFYKPPVDKRDNIKIEENKKTITTNYELMKSAYFGAFLGRFIHNRPFEQAHQAGRALVAKLILVLKSPLNCDRTNNQSSNLTLPINSDFFMIEIKPSKQRSLGKEFMTKKKEASFVLDCVNKVNSKMGIYKPLSDSSLANYYNSDGNKRHLKKMGFMLMNGEINPDPDLKFFAGGKQPQMNSEITRKYEKNQNKLFSIRENNILLKNQISNLCLIKLPSLNNLAQEDVNQISKMLCLNNKSPRVIKFPTLQDRWEKHPLLKKNLDLSRSLSPKRNSMVSSKIISNNLQYANISKIQKKANNQERANNNKIRISQKHHELMSGKLTQTQKDEISHSESGRSKINTRNTNHQNERMNNANKRAESAYKRGISPIRRDNSASNIHVLDTEVRSSVIKRQVKNNVIISKKREVHKGEDSIIFYDEEVEEEKNTTSNMA